MEFAQIWRIFLHRIKSNKISFTSALLITVFLWHTMTAENPASQNISKEDLEITEEESASKSAFLDREERFRDVEREETVKIDIRGINSNRGVCCYILFIFDRLSITYSTHLQNMPFYKLFIP